MSDARMKAVRIRPKNADAAAKALCLRLVADAKRASESTLKYLATHGVVTTVLNSSDALRAAMLGQHARAVQLVAEKFGEPHTWADALDAIRRQLEKALLDNRFDSGGDFGRQRAIAVMFIETVQREVTAEFITYANDILYKEPT